VPQPLPLSIDLGALAADLGCFPLDVQRLRRTSHSGFELDAFVVCRHLVGGEAPARQQCSTSPSRLFPGCTSMHFGENQLSPRSIGISPRPTAHPSGLQSTPVRASTPCYRRFTLAMGSSRGFGSTRRDEERPVQTRFRCGSGCYCLSRPRRVTRRIILQKARCQGEHKAPTPSTAWKRRVSGTISLPSPGYFSPFPHGTVRYRSRRVVSLGRWAALLHTGFLVSGTTQVPSTGC
jgi:hypothetical protein